MKRFLGFLVCVIICFPLLANSSIPEDETIVAKGFIFGEPKELSILKAMKPQAPYARDYYRELNATDRQNLSYILSSLANNSIVSLGLNKSSLQKAAKNLEHIHPLRMISTIFNDPVYNADVHKIRQRKSVWPELFEQYSQALDREYGFSNVLPHLQHFSRSLRIPVGYVADPVERADWNHFFELLLAL